MKFVFSSDKASILVPFRPKTVANPNTSMNYTI
jgi:hypothetical protein